MRNFKKVIALVLALALTMSTFTVAFAAEKSSAEKLNDLGLLLNISEEELGAELTREVGITMILKALGWTQEDADAEVATTPFTDDEESWSAGWAALAAKLEITTGVTETSFAPKAALTEKQFVAFMLRALGYDTAEAWSDAADLGVAAGLVAEGATLDAETYTKTSAADIMFAALTSEVQAGDDAGKTLAEVLVGLGNITEEAAVAAGVYTVPVPEVLAVASVTAANLKTITIALNKEINKDTATADTIKVYSGTTKIATTNVVSEDLKTVYVYKTTGAFDQMKDYKVVVNGVEVKGDTTEKVTGYENTIKVSDVMSPSVVDVVLTSPKTLDLVFSEPVDFGTASQVYTTLKIDGINTYVSTVDTAGYYSVGKIGLTLGTALVAGNHTIVLSGIKDFANFPIVDTTLTVNVPADTAAPKIVSAEMKTTTKVRVVFDEPVDDSTVDVADFDVDGAANSVTGETRIDAKTYDLTLGSALGKSSLVEVEVSYKGIKDFYGNQDTTTQYFTFVVGDDVTAPTMTYAVTTANKVELTFSESVVGLNADGSDFELYDKDNKKLSNAIAVVGKTISGVVSDSVYELTITGASTLSGAHTLKFVDAHGITDASVRANKFLSSDLALTLNDKVAPTISSLVYVDEAANDTVVDDSDAFDAKLTIYFSEAMDATTLSNTANYIVGSTIVSELSGASLTVASDNKSVTITVNATADYVFAGKNIYVLAVKDAAGNVLDVSDMNVAQTGSAFAATIAAATVIEKIEATAKNTLKITMNTGYLISSIDPNKIAFDVDGTNVAISTLQVSGVSIASDAKTATITLNNNLTEDVKNGSDTVEYNLAAEAIVLTTGSKTEAVLAAVNTVIADKILPTVKSIANKANSGVGNDIIVIEYNEPIDMVATFLYDIVVKDTTADVVLTAATDYTVAEVGDKVEITIKKSGVASHKFTVEVLNGRYVDDVSNNLSVAKAATVVRNVADTADATITEKVAPTRAVVNTSTSVVGMNFDEALYLSGTAIADGADVSALISETSVAQTVVSAVYTASTQTITVTLSGAALNTETVVLNVTNITDQAGNAAPATTATSDGTNWTLN